MNERVHTRSRDNAADLAERHVANKLLRDIGDDLWQTEQGLQNFLLLPSAETRRSYEDMQGNVVADLERLGANPWIAGNTALRDKVVALAGGLGELRAATARLMDVRADPNRLYPAMPVMFDRMQPPAEQFFAVAMLAVDEAREGITRPGQTEALSLFYDTLYTWTRMVDAFRLFISNRFGIFDGSIETAMRVQNERVVSFSDRIGRNLAQLGKLDDKGVLEFQQQLSLAEMRQLHRDWLGAWREARSIWNSDRWRFDTHILQNEVRPLLEGSWGHLHDLQKTVDESSTEDLAAMARLATAITDWLWLLVLFGALMAALMVVFFEHQIRRPIARVVSALKAEAAGRTDVTIPRCALVETRDLTAAFDHMRSEVRERQDALNIREQRLRTILDNTAEGIITFDEYGTIEGFNHSAEHLFGWKEADVAGRTIAELIAPQAREVRDDYVEHFLRAEIQRLIGHEGELVGRHKDGSTFPMAVKISGMVLEGRQKYIALVSNISERKALMEHLRRLAEHDGLTGLYNRTYFQGELERLVDRVRRSEVSNCALLYIDLDHFKYVNDTLGHAAGDKLLIEVANILNRRARKSDLVARLGGDEFTVLVYDTAPNLVEKVADSFRRQLADYDFLFEGQTATVGSSIGVAVIDPSVTSPAEIMSRADLACHLAKRGGRNQVHVFSADDAKNVTTMSLDMGWSRRIREAIEKNRFALACQPIVSTRNRQVSTYEVLIRMLDTNGELIMPGGFLPTAERFGLSLDIDRWVIANAIETLAEQRRQLPELSYTINLSAQTLNSPAICDLVQEKLAATGLDPAALIFEITETAAIADMNAAAALLARLRALGCRTALDDFGSGMSSFAYLKELPVDIVKIDGRFVKHIATNNVDEAMVRAMNDIAHALGKETVAEFVESEEAFQKLAALGVDFGQGYHLGRPDMAAPCSAIADHAGVAKACRN
jgi:diguanylate cyclase (GGDEF)-like protein/PAS domain S-box-containing protein